MAHQITNRCTNCGACIAVCPTQSITPSPKIHLIDTDTCDDWGACVGVCPANAIEKSPLRLKASTTGSTPASKAKK